MYYQSAYYTPYNTVAVPSASSTYYYRKSDGLPTYTPTQNILEKLFPTKNTATTINSSSGLTTTSEYYYSPTGSDSVITTDSIIFDSPYHYPTTTRTIHYNTPVYDLPYSTIPPIGLVYPDINNDRQTIDSIVDYFYKLTFNKWINGELSDLINYFKIKDGSAYIIDKLTDYKSDNHKKFSFEEKNKVIDYIKKYFLTKSTLERILSRYCKETSTKWYNLPKNKFYIRPLIGERVVKLIKKAIEVESK